MMIAGITLLALATATCSTSAYLEWKFREPIYMVAMKVGAILLAVGGVVFACAIRAT